MLCLGQYLARSFFEDNLTTNIFYQSIYHLSFITGVYISENTTNDFRYTGTLPLEFASADSQIRTWSPPKHIPAAGTSLRLSQPRSSSQLSNVHRSVPWRVDFSNRYNALLRIQDYLRSMEPRQSCATGSKKSKRRAGYWIATVAIKKEPLVNNNYLKR